MGKMAAEKAEYVVAEKARDCAAMLGLSAAVCCYFLAPFYIDFLLLLTLSCGLLVWQVPSSSCVSNSAVAVAPAPASNQAGPTHPPLAPLAGVHTAAAKKTLQVATALAAEKAVSATDKLAAKT